MTVSERNEMVKHFLNELQAKACNEDYHIDEKQYIEALDKLFETTIWGFREILLVVIIGMKLDPSYRASTGLYDCKPRAIYEGPIKDFLIEKRIPHRKSGPLNIAKAAPGLDDIWAAQRRDSEVAAQVVNLVKHMERSPEIIDNLGVSLLRRLIAESIRTDSLSVEIDPTSDPKVLYEFCSTLIKAVPDGGNTPQKIAAFLLKNYHEAMCTGVVVTGQDDRASVTSTTSKKPGDINEESSTGTVFKVYEITVKPFDLARIRDSYDSILQYNKANDTNLDEIIVICRKEDCPDEMKASDVQAYLGYYEYQNVSYYYLDIFEWISCRLLHMTREARRNFHDDLNSYIADINTAEQVKELWKSLQEQ